MVIHSSATINGLLSWSFGVVALCFQIAAFAKDFKYELDNFPMLEELRFNNSSISVSQSKPDNAFLSHKEAVQYYYKDYYWNLWDEPMSMMFNLVAIMLSSRHIYLFGKNSVVAKSIFLFGLSYVVKILLLSISSYLLFKSYISIDMGYVRSFIKGSKLAYNDMLEDGYMRLACYDGYFNTHVMHDDFVKHFDEETFKLLVTNKSENIIPQSKKICQSSGMKLWALALLLASIAFAALAICYSVCCDTSVQNVLSKNKISPKSGALSRMKDSSKGYTDFCPHVVQSEILSKESMTATEFQCYSNPWSDKPLNVSMGIAPKLAPEDVHGYRHYRSRNSNPLDQLNAVPYIPSFPHIANINIERVV